MWSHPEAHPGEYLKRRFLEPLGLRAADLARGCKMSRSRVSDLLAGKRAITADTAKRLAAFFRMEPEAWMALQSDWDLEQAELFDQITPLDPPKFLIAPRGATPIPKPTRARPPRLRFPERNDAATSDKSPANQSPAQHREVRYADGTRALVSRRE